MSIGLALLGALVFGTGDCLGMRGAEGTLSARGLRTLGDDAATGAERRRVAGDRAGDGTVHGHDDGRVRKVVLQRCTEVPMLGVDEVLGDMTRVGTRGDGLSMRCSAT